MISKVIGAVAFAAAILTPSLAFAQTSTTGLLNVYMQVLNQTGSSFVYSPSNFNVSVSGNSPSINNFPGSQSGTLVTLLPGSYSVVVTNPNNYSASYSVGCNGTIAAATTQTCVITMSPNYNNYYNNPTVAPYVPLQPLTCRTDTPVVGLGQTARFTALGGAGGTYNWMTANQNYPNNGPTLTAAFMSSGTQTVSVTNASQTATCVVQVTTSYVPQQPAYPTYPNTTFTQYGQYGYAQPTLSAYLYPSFPRTGLAPLTAAQVTFALVLLMGATFMGYPYARKAFAIAVR